MHEARDRQPVCRPLGICSGLQANVRVCLEVLSLAAIFGVGALWFRSYCTTDLVAFNVRDREVTVRSAQGKIVICENLLPGQVVYDPVISPEQWSTVTCESAMYVVDVDTRSMRYWQVSLRGTFIAFVGLKAIWAAMRRRR